jgi:mannose/fructose/N-acetylgalactosamine-specific phosphotransferase system component IID
LLSVGFSFALLPVAKWLYKKNPEAKKSFLRRHMGFFNGHPYFISFALGSVMRLEEDLVKNKGSEDQIMNFKEALIGPLGVLGDQLFWVKIKPAVFSLGVLLFLIVDEVVLRLTIITILMVLYNVPHLFMRIYGLVVGYQEGFSVFKYLKMEKFSKLSITYTAMGILSVSSIIGLVSAGYWTTDILMVVVFIISILVAYILKFRLSKSYLAIIVPLGFAILIGVFKHIYD